VAGVILSRAALGVMVPRERGFIINVSSVAAFTPYAWAMYGSTKAFQVAFSQNLAYELAKTGIRVQALCPGFTYTEFHDVIGMDRSTIPKFLWMAAPPVVRASLRALGRRKIICVPGWRNKLFAAALRFAPTAWLIRLAARLPLFRKKAGY
jgi:short-subunit dehydrogenase